MWCKIIAGKLITSDTEYQDTFDMKDVFGSELVVKHYNEHPGVDVIVLGNGKVLSISNDVLLLHKDRDAFDKPFGEVEPELMFAINDEDTSEWTDQYKIKTLLDYIDNQYGPTDISGNHDLWEKCIHVHQNDTGVLPIPFDQSFDEYFEWSEVPGGAFEFFRWLKSIAYAIGYRKYITIDNVIVVPKFAKFSIESPMPTGDDGVWLNNIEWYKGEDSMEFECGADFWYSFLPMLAEDTGIPLDQIQYHMASDNAMDRVTYIDSGRWIPHTLQTVAKLTVAEGFTKEEVADHEYMGDKYRIWLDNGLLD